MLDSQRPKCSVVNGNIWKFALSLMCYILAPHMYCHWISLYILFFVSWHSWPWVTMVCQLRKGQKNERGQTQIAWFWGCPCWQFHDRVQAFPQAETRLWALEHEVGDLTLSEPFKFRAWCQWPEKLWIEIPSTTLSVMILVYWPMMFQLEFCIETASRYQETAKKRRLRKRRRSSWHLRW